MTLIFHTMWHNPEPDQDQDQVQDGYGQIWSRLPDGTWTTDPSGCDGMPWVDALRAFGPFDTEIISQEEMERRDAEWAALPRVNHRATGSGPRPAPVEEPLADWEDDRNWSA